MAIPAIDPYPMPTEASLPDNQVEWQADPTRSVLLLHDMQSYFLAPFARDRPPFTELIGNTVRLRERATELGVPVVYSAQPGGMTRAQRGLLHDFWGPGMSTGDVDVRIADELRPAEGDVVLTKWRYSAFVRSGLREVMQEAGRDQLIVSGVYAHVGCLMTAVDAFSADIQPFFVADALADFSADDHRLALTYAARRCAAVLSTDQLLTSLAAAGPQTSLPGLDLAARRLSALVAEVLETTEQVRADSLFYEELMMDSLQKAEVVFQVERSFGVRLDVGEAAAANTVADVLKLLSARGALGDS